jgi:hypothetical protein
VRLSSTDYFLTRFAQQMAALLKSLGDTETELLGKRLGNFVLDRPVFITGLARSGSTMLLELFSRLPEVGTHRYRDFPMVFVPYFWNRFQQRFAASAAPIERPHRDRIRITKDSPEAFEEALWMHFFPLVHDPEACHRLTPSESNSRFEEFYRDHLRKILWVRGRPRYVSKGNYNIARLEYLGEWLADARFVIPIRHPVSHVNSLVRQHRLFTQYSQQDPRVPQYMRAAGHFEFGPQRVPINLDDETGLHISQAWHGGDDARGYAILWRHVYEHARQVGRESGSLGKRITFVRYEDFCAEPLVTLRRLFEFCELRSGVSELLGNLPHIAAPQPDRDDVDAAQRERVWNLTRDVAESFGYDEAGTREERQIV